MSTDTAGASEIVFALAWTAGYRYAPRVADLADHRLWVTDLRADYGGLAGLACDRANTSLMPANGTRSAGLPAPLSHRHAVGHSAVAPAC